MIRSLVFLAVLGIAVGVPAYHNVAGFDSLEEEVVKTQFGRFKEAYARVYDTVEEEIARFSIFRDNYQKIVAWNREGHNFTLGVNRFADMTQTEYRQHFLTFRPNALRISLPSLAHQTVPVAASIDWRTKSVVNSVKDQGQCGSCYAFSAVQAVESAWAIKNGKLYNLAEQEIVDCDKVDSGCGGGLMDNVFQWVKENGGLVETKNYAYRAQEGKCSLDKSQAVVQVSGFVDVPAKNNQALLEAVNMGPVSVAINAESYQFQFYKDGVFDFKNCPSDDSDLDHGVGVVGYGSQNGKDYWIVRNSWGQTWGKSGYILMARGDKVNQCGILDLASYPVV